MSFNYEKEYKKQIRTYIQKIKSEKENKNTKVGTNIRETKKKCLHLLENVSNFGYNPHISSSTFFVTESRAGFNREGLTQIEQLKEIEIFLRDFANQ